MIITLNDDVYSSIFLVIFRIVITVLLDIVCRIDTLTHDKVTHIKYLL